MKSPENEKTRCGCVLLYGEHTGSLGNFIVNPGLSTLPMLSSEASPYWHVCARLGNICSGTSASV